jgi:hypothetical protein
MTKIRARGRTKRQRRRHDSSDSIVRSVYNVIVPADYAAGGSGSGCLLDAGAGTDAGWWHSSTSYSEGYSGYALAFSQ